MSYDFAVFDPDFAPREGAAFRAWYERQTDWDMDAPDPEPAVLTKPLLAWYDEMTARFPDLNRTEATGKQAIDYCFTPHFVYCSTSSELVDEAQRVAIELAGKLGLGTYDPMSDDGRKNSCIVFPDGPLPDAPSFFSRIFGRTKG